MTSYRWLALVVVAGCGDNVHQSNPSTLVRVDAEAPGANCTYGGVSINTGHDTNQNDALDDDEITSTQYVCNGGSVVRCAAGDVVHEGSITARDPMDFAALAGITCLDGDLIVAGLTGEIPALPDLAAVTGEVILAGNPDITTLDSFAGLREIGQSYLIQGNDSLTDISQIADLETVLSVFVVGNDAMVDVAGLSPINLLRTKLTIASNGGLTSLHGLENLVTAQSWIVVRANRALTDISALENLRSAGAMEISGNASLGSVALPNLEKVDVRLLINSNPNIASVSLPKLVTISDGIVFSGNSALQSVRIPALLATGTVTFENDPSLASIDASSLAYATVDLNFTNLSSLTSANFAVLTSVGGTMRVYNVTPWSFSGFPTLNQVGNLWLNNAGMQDFTGLGALSGVAGDMTVAGCRQLTSFSGLDAMTEIGNNLVISANAALPLSVAQAFANSVSVGGSTTIN